MKIIYKGYFYSNEKNALENAREAVLKFFDQSIFLMSDSTQNMEDMYEQSLAVRGYWRIGKQTRDGGERASFQGIRRYRCF